MVLDDCGWGKKSLRCFINHELDVDMSQKLLAHLNALNLSQYYDCFIDNDIGFEELGLLTSEDLKEIGITSLGHRKQILKSITARPSIR